MTVAATVSGCTPISSPPTPTACERAMIAASKVDDTMYNGAIVATTKSCETSGEWSKALAKYPGAGILTSYEEMETYELLGLVCMRTVTSPVCIDASKLGLLDYSLDDPRLMDLQE